jgi:uncharacterized protein YodC (DUF2158 family)
MQAWPNLDPLTISPLEGIDMKRKQFADIGSVVRANSGGAYMVVEDRQTLDGGSVICTCRWKGRKGKQRGTFLEESLEEPP